MHPVRANGYTVEFHDFDLRRPPPSGCNGLSNHALHHTQLLLYRITRACSPGKGTTAPKLLRCIRDVLLADSPAADHRSLRTPESTAEHPLSDHSVLSCNQPFLVQRRLPDTCTTDRVVACYHEHRLRFVDVYRAPTYECCSRHCPVHASGIQPDAVFRAVPSAPATACACIPPTSPQPTCLDVTRAYAHILARAPTRPLDERRRNVAVDGCENRPFLV